MEKFTNIPSPFDAINAIPQEYREAVAVLMRSLSVEAETTAAKIRAACKTAKTKAMDPQIMYWHQVAQGLRWGAARVEMQRPPVAVVATEQQDVG